MSMSFSSSSSQATIRSKCRRYDGISILATFRAKSTTFLSIRSLCLGNILLYNKQLPHEML
ncbi:hypothetical protein HanRHA438_Chr08g0356801 [Helianthus annuus]|nr:hypothetical protein HanRHA438_Chr08g0356801 [Helianthus annuus]